MILPILLSTNNRSQIVSLFSWSFSFNATYFDLFVNYANFNPLIMTQSFVYSSVSSFSQFHLGILSIVHLEKANFLFLCWRIGPENWLTYLGEMTTLRKILTISRRIIKRLYCLWKAWREKNEKISLALYMEIDS